MLETIWPLPSLVQGIRPLLTLEVILQLNWNSNAVGVRLKWAMADLILDRRLPAANCPTGLGWKASWKPTISRFHKRRTFQFFSLIRSTWQLSKFISSRCTVHVLHNWEFVRGDRRIFYRDKRHRRNLTAFNLMTFGNLIKNWLLTIHTLNLKQPQQQNFLNIS